jgi:general secretion pathway protein E
VKLGEILVQHGVITAEQRDAMLLRQTDQPGKKIGRILVDAGLATPRDVMAALGTQYHLDVLDPVPDDAIDSALIERIPVDWARQNLMMPIRWGNDICVLMADPSMLARLGEWAVMLKCEPTGLLATEEEIKRIIDRAYFERKPESVSLTAAQGEKPELDPERSEKRSDDLLRVSDSAPVTQLMNAIILDAVRKRASDVHFEPFENHVRIRFRIDGFLYEQPSPPKHLELALISRIKVMSHLDIAERRLPQDGMAKVRAGEREIDIRVSTVPVAEGERVVLRLLNMSSTLLPLTELGMPEELQQRFADAMRLPNGIILVTGPTGSGKTTTLYAALREIDTTHRNVMTVEDPIEYQMADIGQIQVKPKIGLTFAQGLRHILRQDPDVILVGEIRDTETAEIAVRAALTGHLVFSTLHTNDAVSALVRLADMGVQPYLLASSVRAILAQRLVRRLCPACHRPVTLGEAELAGLETEHAAFLNGKTGYLPVGCPACNGGFHGRVGIYELITLMPDDQAQLRKSVDAASLRRSTARRNTSMWHDARTKILSGLTCLDEVRRVIEPDHTVSTS